MAEETKYHKVVGTMTQRGTVMFPARWWVAKELIGRDTVVDQIKKTTTKQNQR